MPFLGLGLHILIAVFFAIHAVRTHREIYWLVILLMFPLLGSIIYFFAVYLPDSRFQHSVRKTISAAGKTLDPRRELREAQHAFELTATAHNQMRLANALLESGDTAQAVGHYEACLKGPFASDPEIRFGAARARLKNSQSTAAIELAELLRKDEPAYRSEQASLLLAQAYAQAGRAQDAKTEFLSAVSRYGSIEARIEYALWALSVGDLDAANAQYEEVEKSKKHWTKHSHTLNKPLITRLEAAFSARR